MENIKDLDITGKNVLIIGCPASGKTHLVNQMKTSHKIIHTDDYMQHGYEQAMYVILDEIKNNQSNTLVEGVQGYRLLRKGVQLDCYYPDIVIQLIISESRMMETYKNERNAKKVQYLKGFNKMHDKILNDYFLIGNKSKPEWIKVNNTY